MNKKIDKKRIDTEKPVSQELNLNIIASLTIENEKQERKIRILKKRIDEYILPENPEPHQFAEVEINKALARLDQEMVEEGDFKLIRAQRKLLKRYIWSQRQLIYKLEGRIQKYKTTPAWMEELPGQLYILLNDIRGHSMDLKDSRVLVKERVFYKHRVQSGIYERNLILADYVLYKPDFTRLQDKMGIGYAAITMYLSRLCRILPGMLKLEREGRHGQVPYAVGWFNGYRRMWFFSGKDSKVLKAFKVSSIELNI